MAVMHDVMTFTVCPSERDYGLFQKILKRNFSTEYKINGENSIGQQPLKIGILNREGTKSFWKDPLSHSLEIDQRTLNIQNGSYCVQDVLIRLNLHICFIEFLTRGSNIWTVLVSVAIILNYVIPHSIFPRHQKKLFPSAPKQILAWRFSS